MYICIIIKKLKHNIMRNYTETITVTPNQSKRTFTIRVKDGDFRAKYRTISCSQEYFDSMESHTQGDWSNFLKTCNSEYYTVKKYY